MARTLVAPCRLKRSTQKLIVPDDTLAYVGSANFLNSSEGLSLETGLLVEGPQRFKWRDW